MKRNHIALMLALALVVSLSACNKTAITADRFIDAGEWTATTLSVDGVPEDELPILEIMPCEIYDEVCLSEWKNEEGGHALFAWQFREKGKTFEISRQEEEEEGGHSHSHDHAEEEAVAQCLAFSGVYEVTERGKELMEFTSTATYGHAGKNVILRIEKK